MWWQGTGYAPRLVRRLGSLGLPCLSLSLFLYEGDNRSDAADLASALCTLTAALAPERVAGVEAHEAVVPASALCDDMDSAVEGLSAPAWALPRYRLATPAAWRALDAL